MKSVFLIAAFLTNVKLLLSLSCPSPYTAVGTSGCYYILPESKIDWITAYASCKLDFNGYLVEINNAQEQANIDAFLKRADPTGTFYYWIGGSDMQREASFRWMTSGNYFTYTHGFIHTAWEVNQPDNYDKNEHCVLLKKNNEYYWNDFSCTKSIFLIDTPIAIKGLCEADPYPSSSCKLPTIPYKVPKSTCGID